MNSFGLGLVLNFTDNASSGMGGAINTFTNMSNVADKMSASVDATSLNMFAIAQSMSQVGDTMSGVGNSIMSAFGGITQSVIDTGNQMNSFKMTLSALYGEVAGASKLEEIKKYAQESVFDITGLLSSVTSAKARGVEAMQEVTSDKGTSQKLLDYASDLAAMMPNMRNTYGTGVNASMGAFLEYISEGNALSLKRGAGLDIKSILGEEKGKTEEDRTQQIANLIDKLGIAGYTSALKGTPAQLMSNLTDAYTNFMSKVADQGVFSKYCELLKRAADFIFDIVNDEEKLNAVTKVLSSVINTLLAPLELLLNIGIGVGKWIVSLTETSPTLAKGILLVFASLGTLLIVMGSLLKLSGGLFMLMLSLRGLKMFIPLFTKFASGLGAILAKSIPLIAVAGALYLAWKYNFFGIRSLVENTVGHIVDILSVLASAWDGSMSSEEMDKMRKLGIEPFINSILMLKYYFGDFVAGMKEGFTSFTEGLANADIFKNLGIDITGLVIIVGDFLSKITKPGAEDTWKQIGLVVGQLAGIFVSVIIPCLLVARIMAKVGKTSLIVWGVFSKVLSIGLRLFGVLRWIGSAIIAIGTSAMAPFIVIGLAVGALALIIYKNFDSIKLWWSGVCDHMSEWFGKVGDYFSERIERTKLAFSTLGTFIVTAFQTAFTTVMGVFSPIVTFFEGIGTKISNLINRKKELESGSYGIGGVPAAAEGVNNFAGGLIQVNEKGGELVNLPSGAQVIPHDESLQQSMKKGMLLGANAVTRRNSEAKVVDATSHDDYSVRFESGSVVIQVANSTDAELEKAADKLFKMIERRQKLKGMANRKRPVPIV